MALQTQFVTSFTTKLQHSFSPNFRIKSEKPSEPSDSIPSKTGVGFGPSNGNNTKRKQKGQRDRASSIIRRNPVEKPAFVSDQLQQQPQVQEESVVEKGFILAWLGFGSVILVEGIALAASGFFPDEWDNFLVKYLYPSFSPSVLLFLAGAVAFGVVKYKQNEKLTERK